MCFLLPFSSLSVQFIFKLVEHFKNTVLFIRRHVDCLASSTASSAPKIVPLPSATFTSYGFSSGLINCWSNIWWPLLTPQISTALHLSCSPETALQEVTNRAVSVIFVLITCHCIVIIAADIIKLKAHFAKQFLMAVTNFQVLLQNAQRTACLTSCVKYLGAVCHL